RSLVVRAVAFGNAPTHAQRSRHTLTRPYLRLAETSGPLIRGIAQHRPHHGTAPSGYALARSHALLVEQPSDGADAQVLHRVTLIDETHHIGVRVNNLIISRCCIGLAYVAVTVRRTTQNADLALSRTMALAST